MAQAVNTGRMKGSWAKMQRRPTHRYFASFYPWELQPVALAPVLPGERLINATWQGRAVTDPLASSVVGWWLEHWLFYVPLSLLPAYDTFVTQVEAGDLNTVVAAATAADASTYYAGRGVNWMAQCRDVIVKEWFRMEDEQGASPAPYIRTAPNRPALSLGLNGIEHSLRTTANWPGTTGGALGASQLAQEDAYRTWDYLRAQGILQMDYEDWLRSYGVQAPEAIRRKRPYLLRYYKDWQYPSNTVNQTTGLPVTAVSWATTHRCDKRHRFTEPGFLMLMVAARPKVYRANQEAHGATVMNSLKYWLPAVLRDDVMTSMREDSAVSSPLYDTVQAAAWTLDVRDLLIHGDQFMSSTAALQSNAVALPTAAAEARYATQAMAEALFTDPGAAGLFFTRLDGAARFSIRAAVEDAVDASAAA